LLWPTPSDPPTAQLQSKPLPSTAPPQVSAPMDLPELVPATPVEPAPDAGAAVPRTGRNPRRRF